MPGPRRRIRRPAPSPRENGNVAPLRASRKRAEAVRDRIAGVKDVAGALFRQWGCELEKHSDPSLKRRSRSQLDVTRLVKQMQAAVRGGRAGLRRTAV